MGIAHRECNCLGDGGVVDCAYNEVKGGPTCDGRRGLQVESEARGGNGHCIGGVGVGVGVGSKHGGGA